MENNICQTEINDLRKNNYYLSKSKYIYKYDIYTKNSNMNKIIKYSSNKPNKKNNNKAKINLLYPYKSVPNFNFENSFSNQNFNFNKNKNIFTSNNTSPKNKNLFNKIQKEIKMINLQLSSIILKNKIQQLNNIGKEKDNNNKNKIYNYNNYFSENNNVNNNNSNLINKKINNRIRKRNIVLNNNKNNKNINKNNYIQIKSSLKQNNNITNANSLKNIYYINNNFRINSVQRNENNKLKTPKSGLFKISPKNYNYNTNQARPNKVINIPNKINKYIISTSPSYYPKSAINENNNISYNISSPKSLVNFAFENNINKRIIDNTDKNKIKLSNMKNNIKNKLPQGYFDDYLINNSINNSINQYKKANILRKNKNKKNNIINKNDSINKNISKSRNEFQIESYNNFFINQAKSQKNTVLQTENKIIDFSYIGGSNNKSTNLIDKNKIINNINFSFAPVKIEFDNNKQQNKEKEENKNKDESDNKEDEEIIDPCDLEEKSIILENDIQEEKTENSPQKKLSFEETKLIVKYNQNDYIRNCNQLYKINMNDEKEKNKNNDENNYEKIPHKFISTTKLCNKLKKKNKNLKSNLIKNKTTNSNNNSNNTNQKYNPNLALMKLNELVFDDSPVKEKNENNNDSKNLKEINNKNENNAPFIKKNINLIKKLEECNKKGINYRSLTLSKREINLLNKKKKNLGFKFKNNSQNLLSEKLRENALKSFQNNVDDNELLKINKNRIIYDFEKEKIKEDYNDNNEKLNNSFS